MQRQCRSDRPTLYTLFRQVGDIATAELKAAANCFDGHDNALRVEISHLDSKNKAVSLLFLIITDLDLTMRNVDIFQESE